MKVRILGGSEVGASSTEVMVIDDTGTFRRILIDSGVKMNDNKESDNISHIMPDVVDLIILTHAHLDHIGNTPQVLSKYPSARLMMTRPTVYLSQLNWDDSWNILDEKVQKNKNKKNKSMLDLFSSFSEGLMVAEKNLEIIESPCRTELFPGVFATFFSVGHISGAMGILIEAQGRRIFFTGDISFQDTPTIKGANLQEFPFGDIDAVFTDSTHGASYIPPRKNGEDAMINDSREALAAGYSAFYAAFTIGRGPDVAIAHAVNGLDCFIDGATKRSLDERLGNDGSWCDHDVLLDHSFEKPGKPDYRKNPSSLDDFVSIKIGEGRIRLIESQEQRRLVTCSDEPKIIIASSGMLSGGWSVHYAERFLPDPTALVGLTGYQALKTPGRALDEMIRTGQRGPLGLRDERHDRDFEVDVQAQLRRYHLSGHANPDETVGMVKYLDATKTFLVHGETQGREDLKTLLSENGYDRAFIPQDGDTVLEF